MYKHLITDKYENIVEDFNTSLSVIDRTASKDTTVRIWKMGTTVAEQDPMSSTCLLSVEKL